MSKKRKSQNDQNNKEPVGEYAWILDENLLRDEGVIYGLSEGPIELKIKTIRGYYDKKIGVLQEELEFLENQRGDVIPLADSGGNGVIHAHPSTRMEAHPLADEGRAPSVFRSVAGFVLFSAMVTLPYLAIFEWLGDSWADNLWVGIGAYCLGTFSLFFRKSLFFISQAELQQQGRESWKAYLEEFGLPIIATAFIVIWGRKSATFLEYLGFALLLLAIFLYAGKAWLMSINTLQEAMQKVKVKNRRRRTTRKNQERQEKIKELKIAIKEIEGERELRVDYFISEYELTKAKAKTSATHFAKQSRS